MPPERFLVSKGRAVWQAVDMEEVRNLLRAALLVVVEIYPTLGRLLLSHPIVQEHASEFELPTVFLSPLHPGKLQELTNMFDSGRGLKRR